MKKLIMNTSKLLISVALVFGLSSLSLASTDSPDSGGSNNPDPTVTPADDLDGLALVDNVDPVAGKEDPDSGGSNNPDPTVTPADDLGGLVLVDNVDPVAGKEDPDSGGSNNPDPTVTPADDLGGLVLKENTLAPEGAVSVCFSAEKYNELIKSLAVVEAYSKVSGYTAITSTTVHYR